MVAIKASAMWVDLGEALVTGATNLAAVQDYAHAAWKLNL